MIWTVIWKPAAENELANLWVNGPDRNAISQAADRIDALLRVDPETCGESREGSLRILFEPPLGVDFKIDEGDRLVSVLGVWRISD